MTIDEVIDLLTVAASFDRRTIGKADALAWHSVLGDLDFTDSRNAVLGHYGASREWIMPADVRQRVRKIREDRLARNPVAALSGDLADDPGRYRSLVQANVRRIADGMDIRTAIGGGKPLDGEPPAEWQEARDAIDPEPPLDARQLAVEQAAESRAERERMAEREAS
jgi:hypothetical protein